ncbi:MAG: GNAT family N-acetyltransferase [Gemmatimonadota bacterium]|nr:GNAT family N-acetyltransferase [Gemmatimonadota bacterium]
MSESTAAVVDIVPYEESMLEAVVALSLRAWEPVFESIARVMDDEVYREFHPDWRVSQRKGVEGACRDESIDVWVAVAESRPVGFVALAYHEENRMGEIYMIAVDPEHQRRGIATALTHLGLDLLKGAGMTTAMVETGGDPGHAPARRTYESVGFGLFPIARYFKKL